LLVAPPLREGVVALYTKERTAAIKQILSVKVECILEELKIRPRIRRPIGGPSPGSRDSARSVARTVPSPRLRRMQPKNPGSGWVQLRLFPLPPPTKPKGPKKQ
jgi:hypothetical protein